MEIRFAAPYVKNADDEQTIAERVARIVCFDGSAWKVPDGSKWQLGTSNNFWLRKEGDEFILTYRYATSSVAEMRALEAVIRWLL